MGKPRSNKLQALKRFDALHHDNQNFQNIKPLDFQFLVRMAIENDMLSDSLKVELLRRIRGQQINNTDLNEIIFKSPRTEEWSRIREMAVRSIISRDAAVLMLLQMGRNLLNWSQHEFDIFCLTSPGDDIQYVSARIKVEGKFYYSRYYRSTKLNEAKYFATAELVLCLLGYGSKIFIKKSEINVSVLRSHFFIQKLENWKSKLHEFCAQNKLPFPVYHHRKIDQNEPAEFEAIASIGDGERINFSFPHRGLTIKEAEQRASQSLYQLIAKKHGEKELKRKQLLVNEILPNNQSAWDLLKNNIPQSNIDKLRFYCQYHRHKPPKYKVQQENVEGKNRLKVTVSVLTCRDQTVSHYGLCAINNRENKVNQVKQFVAIKLLQKLQKLQ